MSKSTNLSPRIRERVKGKGRRKPDAMDQYKADPWGLLTVDFAFGSHSYPVDHQNRNAVVAFLSDEDVLTGVNGWDELDTLDDRCVFLNLAVVRSFRFIGPEVNYPITSIRWRGAREPRQARALSNVRVTDTDGATREFPLNDATGGHIALLDNHLHEVGANAFLPMRGEGSTVQILNLSSVATIEVPLESYYTRYFDAEMAG